MSTHQPLDVLTAMRRAASDNGYVARERKNSLWRAAHHSSEARDEYLEWSWIAQACKRELKRLNNLIARRKRAQQVST